MLKRQVEVRQHVGDLPVCRQHVGSEPRGVGVVHADPGNLHLAKGPQKIRQPRLAVEIKSVVGRDLADQNQLLHTLSGQLMGFGHDRFNRP